MDRRTFLIRCAGASAAMLFPGAGGVLRAAPAGGGKKRSLRLKFTVPLPESAPQMAVVRGDSPDAMARAAVSALGGMSVFVSKGDRVAIKPNASWDRSADQGADTHPEIVGALTAMALEAGAREVVVFDNTIGEPRRCFARSGIGPAVEKAGGKIVFQGKGRFRTVDVGGRAIGRAKIMVPLLEADKFINVPVVKHHGLSKLTAAMKNLYGVIGGVRSLLHVRLNRSIVDLARFAPPTLVVLDAVRVMVRNGPSGGRADDLIHPKTIAAGTDQVAMDAYAASLLGLTPRDVGYITIAGKEGLGTPDYGTLRKKTIDV